MENKYSKYTNEELFSLWKEVDYNVKYLIGKELVNRKLMFEEDEYNAIDYYLQKSKMYDSGFYICQEDWGQDYFRDEYNEENLTIEDGLQIIYDSMVLDYIKEYPIEIKNSLKKAMERFLDINLEV